MWDQYRLRWRLLEPVLGTVPKDKEVFTNYIAEKAKTAEEKEQAAQDVERVSEEAESRGWTGFYVDDEGRPVLMDYQFKGFLKNAGNILKDALGVKNLRSHVEQTVFVSPRMMVLADETDGVLERPLRAMTMQGPRVSLARSDRINPGRDYELKLTVLEGSKVTEKVLRGILSYGELSGLLQWRNGGYGRFEVISLETI